MADAKTTPGEGETKLNTDGTPVTESTKKDEEKEPKVGEIVDETEGDDSADDEDGDEPESKPKTVGLDKFLEQKKALKEAKNRIKELESRGEDDIDADDVSDEIDSIAEEFEVSKPFLKKLEKAMLKKLGVKDAKPSNSDDKVMSRLDALEAEKKQAEIDKRFSKEFTRVMDSMPELKETVNPEVIKELTLLPKNKTKTFRQIIEETYGSTVRGRKTIETTTPRGGKEPEGVDFDRAVKDTKYYQEVMANPSLKKAYNEGLEKRIKL